MGNIAGNEVGHSQELMKLLLGRSAQAIVDFDALSALPAL